MIRIAEAVVVHREAAAYRMLRGACRGLARFLRGQEQAVVTGNFCSVNVRRTKSLLKCTVTKIAIIRRQCGEVPPSTHRHRHTASVPVARQNKLAAGLPR